MGLHAQSDALAEARHLIASGRVAEAVTLLRRQPASADAYLMLGTALSLIPERTEAVAAIEKAIALRPESAAVHHTLGLVLGRFAESEAAGTAFRKAIAIDPNFAAAHVSLALLLAQRKDLAQALSHVDRALRIAPDTYAELVKGRVLMELERVPEAAVAFERAAKLQPGNADAFLELGTAQRKLMQDQPALTSLRRAVELAPGRSQAQAELGKLYFRLGQPQLAVVHLTAAMRSGANDRATVYSLGRVLRATGNLKEAEAIDDRLKSLLAASTDRSAVMLEATALNNSGVELEKTGRCDSALVKYAAAAELDPLNPGFRRNMALCLCRLGRWKEGAAELQEVLRLDPDDAEATRALYLALDQPGAR